MRTPSWIFAALLLPGLAASVEPAAPPHAPAPPSLTIGDARLTLGGSVELVALYRSTNVGSGIGTTFNAIPYRNALQGDGLTDLQLSAQRSRFSLRVTDRLGSVDVAGLGEVDFNGAAPANVHVSTNSNAPRMRLYWLDARFGAVEVLAGQAWTWLTPNRAGLSPETKDVFVTQNVDECLQAGLTWGRAGQARVVYHATPALAFGLAVENPDPFVGQGEVIFPFAYNAQIGGQLDAGNNPAAPSGMPDFIPKVALDLAPGGRTLHLEAAGIVNEARVRTIEVGSGIGRASTSYGFGGMVGANVEVLRGVRLLATGFASRGAGRRIGGLGPDFIVRPNGRPSLVRSWSGLAGLEAQLGPATLVAAYASLAYFERNFYADSTSPIVPNPIGGFGGRNSPSSANKKIEEGTVDVVRTLAEAPQHGALQLATQVSFVRRRPWFVAQGAPSTAQVWMGFVDLRYVLP